MADMDRAAEMQVEFIGKKYEALRGELVELIARCTCFGALHRRWMCRHVGLGRHPS